jgi:iron complex transport system ATP-binding protein
MGFFVIGANACVKSTLLKPLARLIEPASGQIKLDGKPIATIPSKQLARVVGLLPQSLIVPEGISVADLVGRGRFPHFTGLLPLFLSPSPQTYDTME